MAEHIFLNNHHPQSLDFSGRGGGKPKITPRTREQHAARLFKGLQGAIDNTRHAREAIQSITIGQQEGIFLSFDVIPTAAKRCLDSLESDGRGILIRTVMAKNTQDNEYVVITVWVPNDEYAFFRDKIETYATQDIIKVFGQLSSQQNIKAVVDGDDDFKSFRFYPQKNGTVRYDVQMPTSRVDDYLAKVALFVDLDCTDSAPQQAALISNIEVIYDSLLENFFTFDWAPSSELEWVEVWLATEGDADRSESVESHFLAQAERLGIEVSSTRQTFPGRTIRIAKANRNHLQSLILTCDEIAEFRPGEAVSGYLLRQNNIDQADLLEDALDRIEWPDIDANTVCVLDLGVNRGHPMLEPVLDADDQHVVKSEWGRNDVTGHGTAMAGLAIYGDIESALTSSDPIQLTHRLESVKLIRENGDENRDLWGSWTNEAVSRVITQRPHISRCFSMSLASTLPPDCNHAGRPTSWSGEIDKIAYGSSHGFPQLFLIGAGNIDGEDYPRRNKVESVGSPGQSWNALTIGAFTERCQFDPNIYSNHEPVANHGSLSPFSTTSAQWENKWPNKPDVVFEGGNMLRDLSSDEGVHIDDFHLISLSHTHVAKPFTGTNATSAATAQAAHIAARLQTLYPHAWPETVRGLIVHSASWTDSMMTEFLEGTGKTDYGKLMRIVGHGVPNAEQAYACGGNSLTLISQEHMQPFKKDGSKGKINEMHLHELPWPIEELLKLEDSKVTLKVTLSYFVDPSPEGRGWGNRYRYASHGLRFDIKKPGPSVDDFIKDLQAETLADEEDLPSPKRLKTKETRWKIGSVARHHGSIHSDILELSGPELADCGVIAVYPVAGWFRNRLAENRCEERVRYSLIVSIETESVEAEIYQEVAQALGIQGVVKVS